MLACSYIGPNLAIQEDTRSGEDLSTCVLGVEFISTTIEVQAKFYFFKIEHVSIIYLDFLLQSSFSF